MAKILVVDDDPMIVELIVQSLAGHEVLSANNGFDGVERARRERPDLIIMDVSMPRLSGTAASSIIKNDPELRSIPIITVTGAGRVAGSGEGFLGKGDGYITKPFSPRELYNRVESLLGSRGKDPS